MPIPDALLLKTGANHRMLSGRDDPSCHPQYVTRRELPFYTAGTTWNLFNCLLYADDTTDRVGVNTCNPQRTLDIFNATAPQVRLTDTASTRYTDLQHSENGVFTDGFYILPTANANGYKVINLFETAPGATGAFCWLDDAAGTIYMPFDLDRNIQMVVSAGHSINLGVAFAGGFTVESARCLSFVPFEFFASFAGGAVVGTPLTVKARYTGGSPSAGFGAGLSWDLETTGDVYVQASTWEVSWLDVTAGSFDSATDFYQKNNNSRTHMVRIDGLNLCLSLDSNNPAVPNTLLYTSGAAVFNEQSADVDFRVESNGDVNCLFVDGGADAVGIGTNAPAEKLDVTLDIRCRSLRLDGDTGAGVANTITLTNLNTAVGGGGGAATLGATGAANTPTNPAQAGWVKIYDGGNVLYLPVWV